MLLSGSSAWCRGQIEKYSEDKVKIEWGVNRLGGKKRKKKWKQKRDNKGVGNLCYVCLCINYMPGRMWEQCLGFGDALYIWYFVSKHLLLANKQFDCGIFFVSKKYKETLKGILVGLSLG